VNNPGRYAGVFVFLSSSSAHLRSEVSHHNPSFPVDAVRLKKPGNTIDGLSEVLAHRIVLLKPRPA
jgi:hypothetical protein